MSRGGVAGDCRSTLLLARVESLGETTGLIRTRVRPRRVIRADDISRLPSVVTTAYYVNSVTRLSTKKTYVRHVYTLGRISIRTLVISASIMCTLVGYNLQIRSNVNFQARLTSAYLARTRVMRAGELFTAGRPTLPAKR